MNAIVPLSLMRPAVGWVAWSREAAETAVRLSAEGKSAGQIAKMMSAEHPGITRNSVIGKLHRLGIKSLIPLGGLVGHAPTRPKRLPRARTKKYPRGASGTARKAPSPVYPDQDLRSRPAIPMPEIVEQFIGIEFVEIKDGLCRWPKGDPSDLDTSFRFCGVSIGEGAVYCPCHARLAFNGTARAYAKSTERNQCLMKA